MIARVRSLALVLVAVVALPLVARGGFGGGGGVNGGLLPVPERPFLLVDAPRRFLPSDAASVHVQVRDGGNVRVALFRVRRPDEALALLGERQGTSIARRPIGAEAEALLVGAGALPRAGSSLELLQDRRVSMPSARAARRVHDETEVYDSNEEDEADVATWGVDAGGWSSRDVSFGPLASGVYLVRVHFAAWAATAVLSVGELVLLARRGDTHDVALVTGPDGDPRAGVVVEARSGSEVRHARTGGDGTARFPAIDATSVRFVAIRGGDVTWADVEHARLAPCDPRVYVATGRPLFRDGEVAYVRGHVRGCDASGRDVPLANERVEVGPEAGSAGDTRVPTGEVRTDADGNFVARVSAQGEIVATVRGRAHHREIRIDDRQLPRRALHVEVDRPWAVAGDVVRVTVADEDGGWPRERDVVLETPLGRLLGRIGPRRPAVFDVRVPTRVDTTLERMAIGASVTDGYTVAMAETELWIGRARELVELRTDKDRAAPGESVDVIVRSARIDGSPVASPVSIAVYGTDGNRRIGAARAQMQVSVPATGVHNARVSLPGEGPWLVAARGRASDAQLVVWERERPAPLSGRGRLAIAPATLSIAPGERLAVDVRAPSAGRTWLTLEQGSVWAHRLLASRSSRSTMDVPVEAAGRATIVATHVARGVVTTSTATVDVTRSRPTSLELTTDARTYAEGAKAHVRIDARDENGRPKDGVVTVWLADAGYWEMGEDEYPLPGPYLQPTGRPASAGDGTKPVAFGSEEGRVLPDAMVEWNGRVLPQTTYRHGWAYGGDVVRVDVRGSLGRVASALARAGGLSGARVCQAVERSLGTVRLRARDVPWDMAALKIAEETETEPSIDGRILRLDCPGSGLGFGSGSGFGRGGGGAGIAAGSASTRNIREQRLEGTLFFAGLERLGPDGHLDLEITLPSHPGRWRIEALVIDADGGGARAHAIAHTTRSVDTWIDLATELRPGDEAVGALHVRAPAHAGRTATLELRSSGVRLLERAPRRVTLDASGNATVALRVASDTVGDGEVAARVAVGSDEDAVRLPIEVLSPWTTHEIALRALVGSSALDVDVGTLELAEAATLDVSIDDDVRRGIADILDRAGEPRWNVPSLRVDRLATLRSLAEAADALPRGSDVDLLRTRIDLARAAEAEALARLQTATGAASFWGSLPDSTFVTAEALIALGPAARESRWRSAWDALARHARASALDPRTSALAARLFATRREGDDLALARRLLRDALAGAGDDLDALSAAADAARSLEDDAALVTATRRLEAALRTRIASRSASPCAGPVWFLCHARWGDRAAVARAASTLIALEHAGARALAVDAASWLASGPAVDARWIHGTAEGDVLELLARLDRSERRRGAPAFEALLDARRVPVVAGRVSVPEGRHRLVLRFGAASERLARLRIAGRVRAVAPDSARGSVRVDRRFTQREGRWSLDVTLDTGRAARDVDLEIPLPAGVTLAGDDDATAAAGGDVAIVGGALRVAIPRLAEGAHTLAFPLVAQGEGRFHAGPAVVRTADPSRWGLTPATEVAVAHR